MLELWAPVNGCALDEMVQQLLDRNAGIRSSRRLARMGEPAVGGLAWGADSDGSFLRPQWRAGLRVCPTTAC